MLAARGSGVSRAEEGRAAGAHLDAKQVEVLTNLAVVAALCLLFHEVVRRQLVLCLPGSAVDALQHAPVKTPPCRIE